MVEGPIPFFALCEHHALPFFGNVWVGYVAHEGIIGISKLTRLVRVVTRRFGVQERMTYQICDELDRMMAPHGVAVYAEAHHLCTQMRGVRELHPKTRTTSVPRRLRRERPAAGRVLRRQRPARRRRLTRPARGPGIDRRPGRSASSARGAAQDAGKGPGAGFPGRPAAGYGGELVVPLRAERPTVIANFVSTLDGVVAFDTDESSGGGEVSGFFDPDRFVMGLLRAMADAVLVGAGTVRASPTHEWTARRVHRGSSAAYAELASDARGSRAAQPTTIVATARGGLDPDPSRPVGTRRAGGRGHDRGWRRAPGGGRPGA